MLQVLFFLITDRDWVALPYVDTSMDEVAVACPSDRNNDAGGRAIYVGAITNLGSGTTHACLSSSSKLMARVSAVRHYL
jgi:hypothetical protein